MRSPTMWELVVAWGKQVAAWAAWAWENRDKIIDVITKIITLFRGTPAVA